MGQKGHGTRALGAVIAGLLAVGLLLGLALTGPSHPPSHLASAPMAPSTTRPRTTTPPPSTTLPPKAPKKAAPWPRAAWVDVAVANVWDHVDSARTVDAAMSGTGPSITTWLAGLDYHGRLGLDDRLATQVLLDDPVVVLDQQSGWIKVRVTHQTGARWRTGIEGWMPAGQITFRPPPTSQVTATVAKNVVSAGRFQLSYGTELPVMSASSDSLTVAVPGGRASLPARDVRTTPLAATGPAVVGQAQKFMGLPYLWAGTSSYGFDCSGLTYAVYRQFGITLPRDAADQAGAGTPVARTALQPGDLVFFAWGGPIDHVGIYAGHGKMIDAPKTGGVVELVNMWGTPLAAHFVAAARYLPS
jgi:gamma-D-glutamyl-L-lysine dipeptidyl-peptidase